MSEFYKPLDALVVLGNNIGPFRDGKAVSKLPGYISTETKLVVQSAAILFRLLPIQYLVLSSGFTSGRHVLSEAGAMDNYLTLTHPEIPQEIRILEDKSIDTSSNAEQSIQIIKGKGFRNVAVLSLGTHATNAAKLFERYGLKIPNERIFAAEFVFYSHLLTESPQNAMKFMEDFCKYYLLSGASTREMIRSVLPNTIDPKGKILNHIAKKLRS